jgi:hypothetical protein
LAVSAPDLGFRLPTERRLTRSTFGPSPSMRTGNPLGHSILNAQSPETSCAVVSHVRNDYSKSHPRRLQMQLSSQLRYDTSGISNLVRIEELVLRTLSPGCRWIRRDSWSSPSERKVCWNTSPVILFSDVVITTDPYPRCL